MKAKKCIIKNFNDMRRICAFKILPLSKTINSLSMLERILNQTGGQLNINFPMCGASHQKSLNAGCIFNC